MYKKAFNYIQFLFIILFLGFQKMVNFDTIELYLVVALLLILFKITKDIKLSKLTIIFSSIFALFLSMGNLKITNSNIGIIIAVISQFVGSFFLISRLLQLFQDSLVKINITEKNEKISATKFIIISSIIGFICFVPYFLKYYPGILTVDSMKQMWQVTGYMGYSNHHPWIHTLLIKLLYEFGFILSKNYNFGVATYTIFQMMLVSITFSYVVYILYKNNVKKILVLAMWLFFFLLPFNAIYSVTMWKDIPFSLITLALTVFMYDHYDNKQKYTTGRIVFVTILSILFCLFRSNGFIAYLIFILALFIIYRKEFFKLKYSIIITLIVVLIFKGPIMSFFKVEKPNIVESLSIPLQQIGYVVKTDGKLSDDDWEILKKFADISKIKEDAKKEVNLHVSDEMKNNFANVSAKNNNYLENHKGEFIKLWFNIGIKNIRKYIVAFILETSGYWYHNYGKFWVYAEKIISYPYIASIDDEIHQVNLLPKPVSKLIDFALFVNSNVYYLIWSPAMSTYTVLCGLYVAITKKKSVIAFIIPIALVLTLLMATPVACEFRYAYAVFLSAPVLLLGTLKNKSIKE